jgi:biopolymer transport protein ExbD
MLKLIIGFILGYLFFAPSYNIDLPEEYPIAKPTDTLIGVKKDNTLYLHFKK